MKGTGSGPTPNKPLSLIIVWSKNWLPKEWYSNDPKYIPPAQNFLPNRRRPPPPQAHQTPLVRPLTLAFSSDSTPKKSASSITSPLKASWIPDLVPSKVPLAQEFASLHNVCHLTIQPWVKTKPNKKSYLRAALSSKKKLLLLGPTTFTARSFSPPPGVASKRLLQGRPSAGRSC